jgi:hypothetical protein
MFHMLLGYLIVRALPPLARLLGRLPRLASAALAWLLNSARKPFHLINYLGSCAGARIIPLARMPGMLDRVAAGLQSRLQQEIDGDLGRGMHYPTTWDPFFTSYMTLAELYRYPNLHYRHHRQQLTLPGAAPLTAAAANRAHGALVAQRASGGQRRDITLVMAQVRAPPCTANRRRGSVSQPRDWRRTIRPSQIAHCAKTPNRRPGLQDHEDGRGANSRSATPATSAASQPTAGG